MDYTQVPEQLIYKSKSLDKLARMHPFHAVIIKRLLKMHGWNVNYSVDDAVLSCLNNAYYICTIMRLEYDATFRENSYKRIARQGYIAGHNTFTEFVTLLLVVILIEHSTHEWHQKLQEVANDLRQYARELVDERELSVLGHPGVNIIQVVKLMDVPGYLSKDIDGSFILPDDFFQIRTIDNNAILDLYRHDPTFNWDRMMCRMHEDDIQELVEILGKTQLEKAILIRSFWKDIYYARKKFDGPIKETWITLKSLAQEFCPDCIEITELHKIPATGLEFEKRISELEEEVNKLKKENTDLKKQLRQLSKIDEEEGNKVVGENDEEIIDNDEVDEWDDQYDDFFNSEINPQKVFEKLEYMDDPRVTEDYPRFFVFFKVLLYLGWIKNKQKIFLKWANCHWKRSWEKDHCFKFSNNIQKEIRDAHISKWGHETLPDISKAYRALAIDVLSKFTMKVNGGKIIDNTAFYNDGVTKRINDGKKLDYPF